LYGGRNIFGLGASKNLSSVRLAVLCDTKGMLLHRQVRDLNTSYVADAPAQSWYGAFAGMEVRVRSADMKVEEGIAKDTFYLTTLSGKPLSTARAEEVVERVQEYVTFCSPENARTAVEWLSGPVLISNNSDPNSTVVTVVESDKRIGVLLSQTLVCKALGCFYS
jgi:hypothetical protein